MIKLIFLMLTVNNTDARAVQAHNDSLLIYNTYKAEIEQIKNATDYYAWYNLQLQHDSITAPAFNRLRRVNGAKYEAIRTFNREGFGVGHLFPKPVDTEEYFTENGITQVPFSIIMPQTKFITDEKGMTRKPFVERVYFQPNGVEKYVERVDPITYATIEGGQ